MSWGRTVRLPDEELPWTWPETPKAAEPTPTIEATSFSSTSTNLWDGEQFLRGLSGWIDDGDELDGMTLRERCSALFRKNTQAQMMIERYVTNVIHKGLEVECIPETSILGLPDDALNDWTELVENRYHLYGRSKNIIDIKGRRTDGDLQKQIYREALIDGDCVVVCRIDATTNLPQIQIVPGRRIETPFKYAMDENVKDGARLDSNGRHLGYYVRRDVASLASSGGVWSIENTHEYIECYGRKSGRHTAWMVYGPVKREDDVRGVPLLAVVMQGLKDIGDFKHFAILKAKLAAMVFTQTVRTQETRNLPGIGGQHKMKSETATSDSTGATPPVTLNYLEPGISHHGNGPGDEVKLFTSGSDVNYGPFETAIMSGMAAALQMPPTIAVLVSSHNYSASEGERDEWRMFLDMERGRFSSEHCQNLFEEWFISELLLGKFQAGQFLESYRDPNRYDEKAAWLSTDWYGTAKPHIDKVKHVNSLKMMFAEGLNTRDRAARETTGTKYSKNCKRLEKENQMLADTMRPFLEIKKQYGEQAVNDVMKALGIGQFSASDTIEEEAAA